MSDRVPKWTQPKDRPTVPHVALRLLPRLTPLLTVWVLVALSACAPQAPLVVGSTPAAAPVDMPRSKVALLLPLTGAQAPLGAALQQATELALFEQNDARVEFLPLDTAGSASGAAEAARRAVGQGARAIVGPLTAAETSAITPAARAARLPVMALTNDAAQAGAGIWALGITPAQQVRRVMGASLSAGARRFGLIAPDDAYGRALAAGMRATAAAFNLPNPAVVLYNRTAGAAGPVQELAQQSNRDLDAVMIGATGLRARELAAALKTGMSGNPGPAILGHALWALDAGLANEPALHGALFAAPDQEARRGFDALFQQAFGQAPPRIAGVAHDAALMGAAVAKSPMGAAPESLPGLYGVDGPLRLAPNGEVLRGLALFRLGSNGEAVLVESALMPAAGS